MLILCLAANICLIIVFARLISPKSRVKNVNRGLALYTILMVTVCLILCFTVNTLYSVEEDFTESRWIIVQIICFFAQVFYYLGIIKSLQLSKEEVIKNILNVKEILHMANTEMVEEVKKQGVKLQNNVLMNKVRDVDSLSENKSFQEENVSNLI